MIARYGAKLDRSSLELRYTNEVTLQSLIPAKYPHPAMTGRHLDRVYKLVAKGIRFIIDTRLTRSEERSTGEGLFK
jgi:hypothetical protein